MSQVDAARLIADGEDPPRITQTEANLAVKRHVEYLTGVRGGKRLRLSFTDASDLVLTDHNLTDAELVAAADRALYRAKAAGRPCTRVTAD